MNSGQDGFSEEAGNADDPVLWLVRERGETQWLGVRFSLALERVPWHGPARRPAGRVLPPQSSIAIPWPQTGKATRAPAPPALWAATPWGTFFVGDSRGRLVLEGGADGRDVLAEGMLPGAIRALAAGPRRGAAWVLLDLDGVQPSAGPVVLAMVREAGKEAPHALSVEWLVSMGCNGSAFLAPVPAGAAFCWVIARGERRALRVASSGVLQLEVEFPLADPVGALSVGDGGLLVAFPGALLRWDALGDAGRSHGGFRDLVDLRPVSATMRHEPSR